MKPWLITVALIGASLTGWAAHDNANYAEQDQAYERGRVEGSRQAYRQAFKVAKAEHCTSSDLMSHPLATTAEDLRSTRGTQ